MEIPKKDKTDRKKKKETMAARKRLSYNIKVEGTKHRNDQKEVN